MDQIPESPSRSVEADPGVPGEVMQSHSHPPESPDPNNQPSASHANRQAKGMTGRSPASRPCPSSAVPAVAVGVAAELAPYLKDLASRRQADAVQERTRVGESVLEVHGGCVGSFASQQPNKASSCSQLSEALEFEGVYYAAKKLWRLTRAHIVALDLGDLGFPAPEKLSTDHLLTLNTVRDEELRLRLAKEALSKKTKQFRARVRAEKNRAKQRKSKQGASSDEAEVPPSAADTYTRGLVGRAARRGASAAEEVLPPGVEHPKEAVLCILSEIRRELLGEANLPVIFQADSRDPKITECVLVENPNGKDRSIPMGFGVSTTYASIKATCDSDACPIYGECYPVSSPLKALMRKLDAAAAGMSPDEVAALEAFIIDQQWPDEIPQDGARGGRDLRLHVSGDVLTENGARLLGAAATRWRKRGGGRVWLYTHSWRRFPASAFGPDITALASVETEQEVKEAVERGYIAFLLMPRTDDEGFEHGDSPFLLPEIGHMAIPCKAQTKGSNCAKCRLCLGDANLSMVKGKPGMVIAVLAHGRDKQMVKDRVSAKQQVEGKVHLPVLH